MAGNQGLRLTSTGAFLKQSDAPDFCSGLLCFENMPKREFFVAPSMWHTVTPFLSSGCMMNTEERLIDLEIRLSRQDDLVDTLNTQVYRQQKKIDELEALCAAMAGRIRELAVMASQKNTVLDERPPHY